MKKSIYLIALLVFASAIPVSAETIVDKLEIRGQVFENMGGKTVEWNVNNFAGFYYDIDENVGTERIVANFSSDSEIKEDALEYISTLDSIDYEFVEDGIPPFTHEGKKVTDYPVIGWNAEKYFAIGDKAQKLSKVIYEQDATETKTLVVGEAWYLGEGYTLTAKQIDGSKVWLSLAKDGVEVESENVLNQSFMVADKDFAGEPDVVYFVTYVDAVLREANMTQLKYTWLVSDNVTEIRNGDTYGNLEANGSNSSQIRLINKDSSITLDQDEEEELFGGLYLKVADDKDPGGLGLGQDIRFYLAKRITELGTYEIRGQVYENMGGKTVEWNVGNFAGFFYDIDEKIGTESIVATFDSDSEIKEDKLEYISTLDYIDYEFTEDGLSFKHEGKVVTEYPVIGWNAEKYFAIDGDAQKLSKVIYEQDATETKTLVVGEAWDLGEGYTLTAKQVDLDGQKVWLSLAKDGVEVESEVVKNFMVEDKDFGGKTDVVYFVTYVDAVFRGTEANMAQLKYTWIVSDDVTKIKNGDTYGNLEASGSISSQIRLINKDSSITLDQDEEEELFGGLYLKVADDKDPTGGLDDIRFYLAKKAKINSPPVLSQVEPRVVDEGKKLTFTVSATDPDGDQITYFLSYPFDWIKINSSTGEITLSPSYQDSGVYTITISASDGYSASSIEVEITVNEVYDIFELRLMHGWNLISLPLVPVDDNGTELTNLTQILAELSGGSVERILTYNAETQLWREYIPNGTSTLTEIKTGIGYFLKMKGSATLTIKGVEIYNNIPRSYELVEGWNLIGYHSESTILVESALNSIDGKYSSLWMLEDGDWKSYIAWDFYYMQPGKGYWIYMNSKGVIPQV